MILYKAQCININFFMLKNRTVYLEPEGLYGMCVIYDNGTAVYLFSFFEVKCGLKLEEIRRYIEDYELDYFKFLDNILNKTSNLSIRPFRNGWNFCNCNRRETKDIHLIWLNIDLLFNLLQPIDIQKLIKKSKRFW